MTDSVLTPAIREEVGRLERADIMVGIASVGEAATIGYVVRAAQAGLAQYVPDLRPVLVTADSGAPDGTQRLVVETEPPDYVEQILLLHPTNQLRRFSLSHPDVRGVGGKGAAIRAIFELAAALDVQALVVVDNDLRSILPEWMELLAGPILRGGFDFVAPLYARHKYDGAITNLVTYPLTRALFGQRVRQPMGGDFGVSRALIRHYLEISDESWSDDVSRAGIDIWLTTEALAGGFAVCQTRLGAKVRDDRGWATDLAPTFQQVVGTALKAAIRHSDAWVTGSGSTDVAAYGFDRIAEAPPIRVDPVRMLQTFESGATTFREAWASMLSSATVAAVLGLAVTATGVSLSARDWLNLDRGADIGRLDTLTLANAMATFRFPDDVWARVLYDVVVAARRGDRPLVDLVAALEAIWMGRVAALVVEARAADVDEAEALVERQAMAFEGLKAEFLARWSGVGPTAGDAAVGGATPTAGEAAANDPAAGDPAAINPAATEVDP